MTQRTHWDDCWKSGPEHYECAVGEAERRRTEYARLAGDYFEEASYLRRRAEQAEADVGGYENLIERQAGLLRGVVNALRGSPPDDTAWSHHDAPELAAAMRARAEKAEAEAERLREASTANADACHDEVHRLQADVERLRAMIESAPHHPDCLSHYACMVGGFCEPGQLTMPRSVQYKCNCWKRAARGES